MRFLHILVVILFSIPLHVADADAHLATFGSWEITERHLKTLFPKADSFRVKKTSFTEQQVKQIETTLGFRLYPEDREPTFYVAMGKSGNVTTVLGVAMFIDPRLQNATSGDIVRLEVGIAVGKSGQIKRVSLIDNKGDARLSSRPFLKQFDGLTLKSSFTMGNRLESVEDATTESQLIANAAHEALYLMKISLGKKSGKTP